LTTDPSGKLSSEQIINGVKVKRFKSWTPNNAYCFSKGLKKHLIKNSDGYDIVHAHNYHSFPALYAAQAKNRNKLVFTAHYHGGGRTFLSNLLHVPYKFFGRKIFEKADKIVCVSNYEKSLILNNFGINDTKTIVIPNGVNLAEFESLGKVDSDYKPILYVGMLEKYKGAQYLIRALPKLDNNITLEIVGEGSYKKSLVGLLRKLRVDDRVKFYQDLPRNELLRRYANAKIFALLSKYEAFGISVAEALASRIPCILANTSALKEWIDDENCFGIDYPIDIGELARLINRIIGKKIKGVVGDSEGKKLWSWEKVVKELEKVYKS